MELVLGKVLSPTMGDGGILFGKFQSSQKYKINLEVDVFLQPLSTSTVTFRKKKKPS